MINHNEFLFLRIPYNAFPLNLEKQSQKKERNMLINRHIKLLAFAMVMLILYLDEAVKIIVKIFNECQKT